MAFCSVALIAVLPVSSANAGQFCSLYDAYPEVENIEIVDGNVNLRLGDYFNTDSGQYVALSQTTDGAWEVSFQPDDQWQAPTESACDSRMAPPIDTEWLERHLAYEDSERSPFNQAYAACLTVNGDLWAGTSFYGGEGLWGAGGLVRKNLDTGEYRYFRPYSLVGASINHMEYFGGQLWIGTTHHGECTGPEDGFGVTRFDLRMKEPRDREVNEVCGFAIRKMIKHDNQLWIATDLGVSVGQEDLNGEVEWQNYVPDIENEQVLRPVECDQLYKELLKSSRLASATGFDMGYGFEDLWRKLNGRPGFKTKYLRELHGHPDSTTYPRDNE